MDKSYISINNLCKSFDNTKIIDNLSFSINQGDLVKISGKNGSGKSTLLKIFAQIYKQDAGEIRLEGENINNSSKYKSKISYCSTDFIYYRDLTVKKNIIFYFRIIGEKNYKELYEKNKNFLNLEEFEHFYPENLSNGQKKKMNLFRALVPRFEIYLIDEPENGLDKESLNELDQKLEALIAQNTILYTSHNVNSLNFFEKTKKELKL